MPSGRMKILQYPSDAKLDRETVKDWLLLALGASDSAVGGPRHNAARRAALARYPFLADLPKLGIGTLDLQYHEAQILRLAMEELMVDHGVGFLPVHDALVVPQSKVAIAKAAIEKSFRHYFLDVLGKGQAPVPIIP